MALKLKTLVKDGNVWNNVYATVKPTIVIKGTKEIITEADEEKGIEYSEETVKSFKQRYNVEVKSDQGDFNYESETEINVEEPTFSQCYKHLKTTPEFKEAVNV
jgi:hypothetical protein